MIKKIFIVLFAVSILFLSGCTGARVEIPSAHRGKILTSSGYTGGLKEPSSFTLPFSWTTNPRLILAEVSDSAIVETMEVFMPDDQLNLKFDVRGTFAIDSKESRIDSIFDRVTPIATDNSNILKVTFDKVYSTYAQQVIRRKAREILTKHTIEDVLNNLESISAELEKNVSTELQNTPINCYQLGLSNVQPPQVVLVAQEQKKKRQIEIEKAEADKLVKLKEAEAALEVAKKQQEVDLIEAETQVLVDKKLAEGVNERFVLQRTLKALDKLVERNNVIFLPMEALKNPSMLVGLTEEALKQLRANNSDK